MSTNPHEPSNDPPGRLPKVHVPLRSVVKSYWFRRSVKTSILAACVLNVICMMLEFDTSVSLIPLDGFDRFRPSSRDPIAIFLDIGLYMLAGAIVGPIPGYWVWRRKVLTPLRKLTGLIADDPKEAAHYLKRGEMYVEQTQEIDRAVADFSKAIECTPDAWASYYQRGHAYFSQDQHELTVLDITQAIVLANEADESDESSRTLSVLHRLRSLSLYEIGEYKRAIADVMAAIRYGEAGDEFEKYALARLYYTRAMAHLKLGDRISAKQDFRQAHRLDRFWNLDPRQSIQIVHILLYALILAGAGVFIWHELAVFIT